MTRFKWRHQYDDAADEAERCNTRIHCCDESKTQQHFTVDADINELVRRFGITDGAIPPAAQDPSHYGDFSDAPTFRQALDQTKDAQDRFNALPANLRNRFGNDPVELWRFVNNPDNAEESVTLGLLKKTPVAPQPAAAPAVTPPVTPPIQ